MKKIYFILIMLVGVLTSCYKPADELCIPCYMLDDNDYMVEHYDTFRLVETWVSFDTFISCKNARAIEMRSIYEVDDIFVVTLYHSLDTFMVTTSFNRGEFSVGLNAGPAVDFDSCMAIIDREGIRSNINTKYALYSKWRDNGERFTEDGMWVFFDGDIYRINAETGKLYDDSGLQR